MLFWQEGSVQIKGNEDKTGGTHGMQRPNLRNNHQPINDRGCSHCVRFILILTSAQYERSDYYLDFEGQESEAREIIKLPKGIQFTS